MEEKKKKTKLDTDIQNDLKANYSFSMEWVCFKFNRTFS